MAVFRERLAYLRWLRLPQDREALNDRALAEAAGVAYEWLAKWKKRDDAPTDRAGSKALARYFGASEDWLFDGVGDPPRPDLWESWIAGQSLLEPAHTAPRTSAELQKQLGLGPPPAVPDTRTAAKKAAGSHRGPTKKR